MDLQTTRYVCDGLLAIPAAYVNDGKGESVVALSLEGLQGALTGESTASVARYGWSLGGARFVWHVQCDEDLLLWRNGLDGTGTPILADCRAQLRPAFPSRPQALASRILSAASLS